MIYNKNRKKLNGTAKPSAEKAQQEDIKNNGITKLDTEKKKLKRVITMSAVTQLGNSSKKQRVFTVS